MPAGLVFIAWIFCPSAFGQGQTTAATAESREAQIEEILVTAQRRTERLQDVPITVNAVTGTNLANMAVTGTSTLQAFVPSLAIARQANGAAPFLRGVGFLVGDANAEGSVAIYLDGVYQPMAMGNFFEFDNIDRVEVLKGPQGTLFGRNATGGVIQVITRDPSHDPEAEISVGYGNYQTILGSLYGTAGFTESLAADLAVMYTSADEGYGRNLTTGLETVPPEELGVRTKWLYTPGETTKITLAGDYSHSENAGINAQPVPGATTIAGGTYPGRYNLWSNWKESSDVEITGASLQLDQGIGALHLKSISAWREIDGTWLLDQDMSQIPLVDVNMQQSSRLLSQELHLLSSAESTLQWLVGVYYLDYEAAQDPLNLAGLAFAGIPGGLDAFGETQTTSASVFTQGTYPIAENTNLTLGFRYTWDETDSVSLWKASDAPFFIDPPTGEPAHHTLKYDKPTWRISVDHRFAPDVLGYASYNRGIKSGNFSVSTPPSALEPYLPEQLDAYEVGLKTESLDNRLRLNGAAFYYDFKNLQFQQILAGTAFIFNGPSSTLYGAELESSFQASENLSLFANIGWLDTEIGDFPNAPNTIRLPNGLTIAGDPSFNAKGNEMPYAPDFTGSVGFNYRIPASIGEFALSANAYYNDGNFAEVDNRLTVDSYLLVNATLGWTAPDGALSAQVWGKNLSDEYYYAQLTGQANLTDLGGPAPPRTYGLTIKYKF